MSRPVVVVTDYIFPDLEPSKKVLSRIDAEIRVAKSRDTADVLDIATDADGIITCYSDINADVIGQLKNCKIITRTGTGFDNIDVAAATEAGIVVANVRAYCDDEVSDHAMALLLALVRKIPFLNTAVHGGRWDEAMAKPIERPRGKTLGLAGFGTISRQVAAKAQAFGINVQAFDPYVPDDVYKSLGVKSVSLEDLTTTSDYISLHAPLNAETHHMFNAEAFDRMKSGSYLVNTARGELIDVEALADALDEGKLAGAGLDVLPSEPPDPGLRLIGRDNVLLTPHVGFYSENSIHDLQAGAAEQVALVLEGKPPQFPVNPEVLVAWGG